jgi:hypothetical protein
MTVTGEKNLNWTKFRDTYLFSVTSNLALGIILFLIRRDFAWHGVILLWLVLNLVFKPCREIQKKIFFKIGHFNSTILLSVFYFLFFTPFSLFYKSLKRHESFQPSTSRWTKRDDQCDFDRPF